MDETAVYARAMGLGRRLGNGGTDAIAEVFAMYIARPGVHAADATVAQHAFRIFREARGIVHGKSRALRYRATRHTQSLQHDELLDHHATQRDDLLVALDAARALREWSVSLCRLREHGWSPGQVAIKIGVTSKEVTSWEAGLASPGEQSAARLAGFAERLGEAPAWVRALTRLRAAGWRVFKLAAALQVLPVTVTRWCRRVTVPRAKVALRLLELARSIPSTPIPARTPAPRILPDFTPCTTWDAALVRLRKRGWTMTQVAVVVGVGLATVERWVHGTHTPRKRRAAKLVEMANTPGMVRPQVTQRSFKQSRTKRP